MRQKPNGFGARDLWVGEPLIPLFIEFEEVTEAKFLSPAELAALVRRYGSTKAAGIMIGASEAFVRQNSKIIGPSF